MSFSHVYVLDVLFFEMHLFLLFKSDINTCRCFKCAIPYYAVIILFISDIIYMFKFVAPKQKQSLCPNDLLFPHIVPFIINLLCHSNFLCLSMIINEYIPLISFLMLLTPHCSENHKIWGEHFTDQYSQLLSFPPLNCISN